MQQIEDITTLANRAAALLPEAPLGDAVAYLAWRELVWSTAMRLADLGGSALSETPTSSAQDSTDDRMTGTELLAFAAMLRDTPMATVTADAAGTAAQVDEGVVTASGADCARVHVTPLHSRRTNRHGGGAVHARR